MFWRTKHLPNVPKDYHPPTDEVMMSFQDWQNKATWMQTQCNHTELDHWYFRLNGLYNLEQFPEAHVYLYDELPFFVPKKKNFFMVNIHEERGINCRFGMKGIISEAHHDASRNSIVVLGGQRRYILAHPNQCSSMELYPMNHPSGRQSSVDWSTRLNDQETLERFRKDHPKFCNAQVNEVVLQAGDALYLPTSWFHYIVSLNMNYQCNARSGSTSENADVMRECGQ